MTAWDWAQIQTAGRVGASRVRVSPDQVREISLSDVAISGAALAVAMNPDAEWADVTASAQRAVWDAFDQARHAHGLKSGSRSRSFMSVWLDWFRPFVVPHVCETTMTLLAVLTALPDRHQRTLAQLAFTDSMEEAAELAGVNLVAFRQRARTARTEALKLWFDEETPPPLTRLTAYRRGKDRTCPSGHQISGDNIETEVRAGRRVDRCRICRTAQRAAYKNRTETAS